MPLNKGKSFRRTSAFGDVNIPLPSLRKAIRKALWSARCKASMWERPTTGTFPADRLRRQLASAMELGVLFTPKFVKNDKPRNPWEVTPLWRVAPKCAFSRSSRVSSLLHLLVRFGWKCPPNKLAHLLERLAINIWRMTSRSFSGLCQKIKNLVLQSETKSRPLLRCGSLSNNPIISIEYFLKPRRTTCSKEHYGVTHPPDSVWLACWLKNLVVRST